MNPKIVKIGKPSFVKKAAIWGLILPISGRSMLTSAKMLRAIETFGYLSAKGAKNPKV